MKKLFSSRLSIAGYALVIAMFLSAISFISCKKSEEGGGSGSSSSVAVTSVSLNKTTLSMSVGGTEILTATVLPEKATNKTVTWESSNKAVATVSNGTVTAISEGSATITVKSADGKKSAKCEVTVKASSSVTEIKLNKTTLSLEVGAKETLTANTKVKWSSSAPLIASVTTEGVVTGVAVGKATITATSEDGKLTAKCEVEVKASSSVTEIKLNKTTLSLDVGAKETLTANTKVKWSSSAPLIASVTAEGVVTGIAVGKATITATSEDGKFTAKCEVEVKAAAVTEIKLNVAETITLAVGGTQTINCTVSPYNAGNKNVKWTTSDNTKVEISSQSNTSATIKAVAEGSVTITATTEDGNHTAKCTVKVVAPTDFEGEGTEADPYRISTLEHLKTLATKVNGGEKYVGKYFKLMNDIDLGGSSSPWTPIGSVGKTFNGSFDGNSKTISGLYINQPTLKYQALFGYVDWCEIKNLTVTGSVTGGRCCGGIVAQADDLIITACTSNVTVIGESWYVGGIVGQVDNNNNKSKITSCTNKGKITGKDGSESIGGIVGSFCPLRGNVVITDCSNSGNVAGGGSVGGIAGYAGSMYGSINVFSCYNSGTISSDSESGYGIGGIVGCAGNGGSGTDTYIVSCYNAGAVTAPKSGSIGGVVGYNKSGVVSSCYNTASVSGNYYVGGVVGQNLRQVIASYNRGAVSGNSSSSAGGVIGYIVASTNATATMSYCLNAAGGGMDVAVGKCDTGVTVGTDVAALSKADMTNGTMLKDLNTAVDSYNSTKPAEASTAKKFTKGTDGWPVF